MHAPNEGRQVDLGSPRDLRRRMLPPMTKSITKLGLGEYEVEFVREETDGNHYSNIGSTHAAGYASAPALSVCILRVVATDEEVEDGSRQTGWLRAMRSLHRDGRQGSEAGPVGTQVLIDVTPAGGHRARAAVDTPRPCSTHYATRGPFGRSTWAHRS